MVTDDERREAAARLRGRQGAVGQDEDSPELTKWEDLAAIVLTPEQFRACMRFKNRDNRTKAIRSVIAGRIADLIEPSEPKVRCVAEVKVDGERLEKLAHDAAVELTGIDRDELLEEVKELEKCAWYFGLDFDEDEPLRDRLEEASEAFAGSANRIREALGVES